MSTNCPLNRVVDEVLAERLELRRNVTIHMFPISQLNEPRVKQEIAYVKTVTSTVLLLSDAQSLPQAFHEVSHITSSIYDNVW